MNIEKEGDMLKVGAVDLFCGIGGLTYGLQQSGINVVAGIDLDESCKFPFEYNNNSQFIHKNISEVTGKEIKRLLKGFDVKILVGCAPCQPFSSHRKDKKDRKSHKDWSLLYQFSRVIKESSPDIISMENVPALVEEKVFIDFVNDLKTTGYHVTFSVINVSDYGVAQSRRRLILLASKKHIIQLVDPTHKNCPNTVRNVIGNLPAINAGEVSVDDRLHQASILAYINIRRIQASKPNGTWRDWPDELILKCHKKESGHSYSSVYGRMGWDNLAPTMTTQFNAYGTGRFGHPIQDRALSLREGALLQSFPPNYSFLSESEIVCIKSIARHIGNAVPPRLGEIVGDSIQNCLSKKGKKKEAE